MKSTIAVLLALVLIVAAVPVFAEREAGRLDVRTEAGDDGIGIGVAASGRLNASDDNPQADNDTRMRGRERADQRQEIMEQLKEQHRDRVEALKEAREITREHIEAAMERVKENKDRLKELQSEYKAKRDEVKQSRDALEQSCKRNSTNSTECKGARERFKESGKEFVGNAADQMLTVIATMKTRVQTNPHIDNATATKITAQLDARTSAIVAAQAKLNTNDTNATQAAAQELRIAWQQARVTIRLTEGLLEHARFQEFLDRLNNMDLRLREASADLKNASKDTTQLDKDIDAFSAKLDAATQAYVSARDSYVNAMATVNTEADASALVKATREQLKGAESDAKDARQNLRDIIKELKALDAEKLKAVAAQVSADAKQQETVEDSEDVS